ncbi:MAG TPA: hypothetical protein VLB50_05400, partial [Ignavibacteriaceae bacterium]|nr:hypothetical protein [Ignavibacteriaceae bacterium]
AEEQSGIQKTVLLCLMGVEGTLAIEDDENKLRKFPAFRFPESAVNALGRVVKYVEYRKKPPGKLVWNKDVKAGEARMLINNELEGLNSSQAISTLNHTKAVNLLECFGINYSDRGDGKAINIKVRVKPDPLFGPLIEIEMSETKSILRITPLTDADLNETLEEMNLNETSGIKEVLGRLSQMIEEIPWLWEFEALIIIGDKPLIMGDILLSIKSGGAERPTY